MARRGDGVRSIAKQLGCSRNTVRRYLREPGAKRYKAREPRPCKLNPYTDYLQQRVQQAKPRWIPATVLLREIQERGYEGGISQLKAWLAPLKASEPETVVRFETPPGQQMQADFTTVRRGATRSGAGGHDGLQPCELREVHDWRGRCDALRVPARSI